MKNFQIAKVQSQGVGDMVKHELRVTSWKLRVTSY